MALHPSILLAFLLAIPASAQEPDPVAVEHTRIVSATAEPATAKPGDVVHLVFKLRIDPDWHIYSANGTYAPTEWSVEAPFERAGKVEEPTPKRHRESLGKGDDAKERFLEYDYHEGEVTFRVPVKLAAAAKPGPLKVKGKITGQECDPRICIGLDLEFAVDLTVAGEAKSGDTTPPPAESHTRVVSVTAEPAKVKVGETFHLVFTLEIEKSWYIYGVKDKDNATRWKFDAGVPAEVAGTAEEPKTKHGKVSLGKDDDGKEEFLEYDYHEGKPAFRVPVRLTAGAKPGSLRLAGVMSGQECSNVCMLFDVPFRAEVTVVEGGVAAPPPTPPAAPTTQETPKPSGMGAILAWAIVGGLVSLVMPCVYPLLPITLTYFLKQGGESRAKSVAMSTAYALGIIIVFTGVGFLFSVILGADGPRIFAANPWVNIAVALLFFWFAFSLFGLYEINLPSWLTGAVTGQQRSGIAGAFILGSLFSVVTFTCTIPFAANILTVAASAGAENKFAGLIGMIVYSVTMALPFFVLGIFPSLIKEVPKSGGWLHTVKVTAGFGELALALLYLAKADQVTDTGVLTRTVMIAVWVAVLAFMALYLLGVFRMKEDGPPGPVGLPRALVALLFIVIAVYMGSGFSGRSLGEFDVLLPVNMEGTASKDGGAKHNTVGNYDDALRIAKEEGKPIFLEFTGVT